LEPLWIGRVEDLREGETYLRDADLSNRKTHEANHHARSIDALLHDFREVRIAFVEQLDVLDDSLIEHTALHPRLQQPMRLLDLLFFVAEHDDHHLAQITQLKRSGNQN
ncbi:MAG TPA: DinB family protein, partial [Rhodothermales bacterium]|nr:DinB family protein [Rhodothermales bacterium]